VDDKPHTGRNMLLFGATSILGLTAVNSSEEVGMVHFAPGNMLTVRARRIGNSRVAAAPIAPELSTRI